MNSILLIGDIVGYGNLGLSAMIPILTNMKFATYKLPTSIVSNNFSYGDFAILDTTEYIRECIKIWKKQNFSVDAVCTGYLVSEEQTLLISDFCKELKKNGTHIFVDPIMADNGKLYNGATTHTIEYMRYMCKNADIIVPNFTEAKFLANKYLEKNSLSLVEATDLITILHALGRNSVVISSMIVEEQTCTMIFEEQTNTVKLFPYEMIPSFFSGTGDIFSSILIGKYLHGCSLENSVLEAMNFVRKMIQINQNYPQPDNGIPIEQHLKEIF